MAVRDSNCTLCPLHKSAQTVCVPGEGPEDAEVTVIGEAPGKEEDRRGRPFVGPSGQLIREELRKAGFHSVYITNVVKCRPPDNRDPKPEEIKACRVYLEQEIKTVGSKYVLTLGRFSSKSVLKKSKITIDHGNLVILPQFVGMPAYHPAYVLRDPSKLSPLQHDLKRLRNEIDGVKHHEPKWRIVSRENISEFFKAFAKADEFSYDCETTGLFPFNLQGKVRCLSIGLEDCAWVIMLDMPGTFFRTKEAMTDFLQILETLAKRGDKCAIAQNGKFDQHWLKLYHGVNFGLDFDTMLASHILDENTDHDLKYLARTELDAPEYDLPKDEKLGSKINTPGGRQRYLRYAAFDAAYTLQLKGIYAARFSKEPQLRRLFYKLVMRAARAVEKIECRGITLDMPKYAETETQVRRERDEELAKLNELAEEQLGVPINWNSPAQISKLLYGKLKLKCSVKTKTGNPSTGEDALVELRGQHPVADQLVKYRELGKFLGTYIEGWKEFIYEGKLFLGYKIHGTITGRYSSRLHQVPRDGTIRNLAIAPPGWEFAQADLSQAELRIAAELSRDIELVSCFRPGGQDVHWRTLMYMIGSGRTNAIDLTVETAKMYCLRSGLSPDGASCEILQEVWKTNFDRTESETLLQLSREVRKDQESGSGERGDPNRFSQSILERWGKSFPSNSVEERTLRALWRYTEFSRTSHKRESQRESKIQLSDALSLVSCITPSIALEFSKAWKEWRKKAKAIGFGFIFGMYENKFIQQAKTKYDWDCTYEEAHAFRTAYFELYQGVLPWHEKQRKIVKIDGQVKNLFGRVRRLPGIYSSDRELRGEAERQAINSPVQGTIGDWKSAALVEIEEMIPKSKLRLVGEHHDALLMIFRPKYRDEVLPLVRRIMCRPKLFDFFKINTVVPMQSEIEIGCWGGGKSYEDPK